MQGLHSFAKICVSTQKKIRTACSKEAASKLASAEYISDYLGIDFDISAALNGPAMTIEEWKKTLQEPWMNRNTSRSSRNNEFLTRAKV